VSNLNKKIYAQIEAWRHQPIEGEHPYLYLDGIVLKRTWAGEVRNVGEGYRQILGIVEGAKEDKAGWDAMERCPPEAARLRASRAPAHRGRH
jgi:transposase-like protein